MTIKIILSADPMRFRTVRYFVVLSVVATVSFACGSPEAPIVDWCRFEGAAVPAIISTNATTSLQLEEIWRAGNSSDDTVLAEAFAPAIDRSGRIAIPDPMLQQVILIGPEGEWRGPLLTAGEGPGEVMVPVASQWSRDGSLVTLDVLGPKTVRYDVNNNELLADERGAQDVFVLLSRYGELEWIGVSGVGEILMEAPRDRIGGNPTTQLSAKLNWYDSHNTDAKPVVLMDIQTTAVSAKQIKISPGFLRPLAAIGPGNMIALAGDTDKYRVRLLDVNRADSVLICRDVPALPLTESERGVRLVNGLEEFIDELRVAERPANPLAIGRIFFGATGRLWIQRDREDPYYTRPTPGGTYDIFGTDGKYDGTVTAPKNIVLHGESEELVIGYEYGQLDEVSVVAYRFSKAAD